MGKAGRVVVGLGIVTLGVCAALPFQRREVALRVPSAGTTPASGDLQVRGLDVPAGSLERLPVLAMESSPGADAATPVLAAGQGPASSATSLTVEARVARATAPTLRLDHPSSAVPRIAESFSEAVESPEVAGMPIRETLAERSVPPTVAALSLDAEANSLPLGPAAGPVRLGAPVAWPAGGHTLPSIVGPPLAEARELLDSQVHVNDPTAGDATGQAADAASSTLNAIRHRIRDGDTLPDLARRYLGDAGRASEIFEANRQVLSRPDILPLGQVLRIPARNPAPAAATGG